MGQVVSEEALKGVTRADFTETLVASSSSSQTGSQMYMAPELLAGKPASTRSDIYSLGVVLYQFVMGDFSKPITTDWAADIVDGLLRDDLQHCFAGNPQDRFTGAGQLARNLRALPERQQALEKRRAELVARERAAYRMGVLRTAAAALLVIFLIGLLAAYAWSTAQQQRLGAYVSDMNVANLAQQDHQVARAAELVEKYLHPKPWEKIWADSSGGCSGNGASPMNTSRLPPTTTGQIAPSSRRTEHSWPSAVTTKRLTSWIFDQNEW
ncbi:MAG: hypothetical protein EXS36_19025 [Pedosphaera sp.]|nr:hypothetical protein [Pedosphaera sp.]